MKREHLQYWHKKAPSKRDALIVLADTLALLSEALPIALSHVGSYDCETQEEFWHAFYDFNRETDLSLTTCDDEGLERQVAIGIQIRKWADVVAARLDQPEGELE
jgi:hypothetical protein